ncbi:MAG: PQQ-binding-like beta-propeller repeat protein, partial [Planctomycetaceae bacterium]|nr:PQQ-binding-like beta-propeller repeat protein [Planctomycetaceae bacterium]
RGGHLRYLYGLTPSAANGIIFCPTGLGMIFAIDATTVTPLWCFSYEQTPTQEDTQDPNRRQLRINMVGIDPNVINNEYYRQLFEQSGWQVPSIMIDGSRVLIAPPDLPVLYCVDSLTGKLLWQVTNLNWKNTLYIACIHNKIAYVVTPVSVLALSMDSGQQVWEQVLVDKTTTANVNNSFGNNAAGFGGIQNLQIQIQVQINPNIIPNQNQIPIPVPIPVIVPKQLQFNRAKTESAVNNNNDKNNNATVSTVADNSAAKLPKLVFPARLRPVGVGVHNGNFYYVPLSDGYIGVINLAECSMRLVSSPESVISSEKQPVDTNADENQTTSNLSGKGFNIPFGNLIGLRGKFFSQSPSQLTCFDQWLDLNERTEELLKKNPNDALGLLRLGKIRRLENNMNEAVLLFRRSLQNNPSEVVTYHLRQTLIEAIKNDFKSWKHFLPELESLALTPDERGEILYAKAQGEAKDDNVDEFASTIAKIFNTESELHTNVTLDNTALNTQLHNMTAVLIDQIKRNYNNPHLSQKIDQTANEIFNNIRNNNFNSATSRDTESVDSVKEMIFTNKIFNSVLPQVRRWRTFVELFRTLPIAEEARELLRESYTKDNFHLATEMLLDLPVSRSSVDERSGGNVKVQKMERLPKLAEMQQLASQFETHGVVSDAYYYYKLIADLYGEKGKEIANNALQKNTFKDYNKQNTTPKEWSKGDVSVQIDSIEDQLRRKITPKSTAPVTINTYAHAILRLARGGSNLNARPLMFIGEYEPFLSPYQYSVEFSNAALELAAYDQFGKECWQFDLSEHISEMMINRTLNYSTMNMNDLRFNILTHFLKGCDHLLVFAYGNKMIAIDTFGCGHGSNLSPRILWSKQLSNDYQFIEKRLSHEINPTGNINSQIVLQTASSNHDVMIHVSRNVICYREDDKIHGINPLTGDTMWTRNVKTQACSILGNRDSVFLFYPATRNVVAIEPFSGAEIKQGVLAGDILTSCGTNVIIDKIEKSGIRFQSLVSDLNDMFLDDAEIKLCSSIDDVVQNELF